jgi:hypothetical protein
MGTHRRAIVEIVLCAPGLLESGGRRLPLPKPLDRGKPFEPLDDQQARFLGKRLVAIEHNALLRERTRLPSHVDVQLSQGFDGKAACLHCEIARPRVRIRDCGLDLLYAPTLPLDRGIPRDPLDTRFFELQLMEAREHREPQSLALGRRRHDGRTSFGGEAGAARIVRSRAIAAARGSLSSGRCAMNCSICGTSLIARSTAAFVPGL